MLCVKLLGFEVDFVNSVQFSNHTQYEHFKGQRLNSDELSELFEGLRLNSLLDYTHLLTGKSSNLIEYNNKIQASCFAQIKGYVGNVTFLNKLADLIEELKKKNPNLIYREFFSVLKNIF